MLLFHFQLHILCSFQVHVVEYLFKSNPVLIHVCIPDVTTLLNPISIHASYIIKIVKAYFDSRRNRLCEKKIKSQIRNKLSIQRINMHSIFNMFMPYI